MSAKKTSAKKPHTGKTPKPKTVTAMTQTDGRHYPDRPVVGVGIVIWRDDKVLLVKRGRPPRQGVQLLGETVFQAAAREAREETDLEVVPLGIVTVIDAVTPDASGKIEYHYTIVEIAAEARDGEAKANDDAEAVRWAGLEEIAGLCVWPEVLRIVRLSALERAL
jgi:ADP-ribose pyrophosphatase YjhB (NUDIX family)